MDIGSFDLKAINLDLGKILLNLDKMLNPLYLQRIWAIKRYGSREF